MLLVSVRPYRYRSPRDFRFTSESRPSKILSFRFRRSSRFFLRQPIPSLRAPMQHHGNRRKANEIPVKRGALSNLHPLFALSV